MYAHKSIARVRRIHLQATAMPLGRRDMETTQLATQIEESGYSCDSLRISGSTGPALKRITYARALFITKTAASHEAKATRFNIHITASHITPMARSYIGRRGMPQLILVSAGASRIAIISGTLRTAGR